MTRVLRHLSKSQLEAVVAHAIAKRVAAETKLEWYRGRMRHDFLLGMFVGCGLSLLLTWVLWL